MAGEPVITLIGNLTADPDLRYTNSGIAYANFTVASTPRTRDPQSGEWKEGEALFMRCTVWRDMAENVAESLSKGSRVVVHGRMRQRSYTANDGSNRTSIEMDVDEVAPSLRYATARPEKVQRSGGGGFNSAPQNQGGFGGGNNQPFGGGNIQQGGGFPGAGNGFGNQGNNFEDPWGNGASVGGQEEAPF